MRLEAYILLVTLVPACGSSSGAGPARVDGGGGTSDGATNADVLLTEPPDGGSCNAVPNSTVTNLMGTSSDAGAPTPLGGVVVDGVYFESADTGYEGYPIPSGTLGSTSIRFAGGVEEYSDGSGQTINRTFVVSGTGIVFTEVCHVPVSYFMAGLMYGATFTATPTQYLEFGQNSGNGILVKTYTRQ